MLDVAKPFWITDVETVDCLKCLFRAVPSSLGTILHQKCRKCSALWQELRLLRILQYWNPIHAIRLPSARFLSTYHQARLIALSMIADES